MVQLCVAQPNEVTWAQAFLLDGEEYLGRKELVLDICGQQERKIKSSPISEIIIRAGDKRCLSDMCPSARQVTHWPLRSHVALAGRTNSEFHFRGTTEQSRHTEAEHTGGIGGVQKLIKQTRRAENKLAPPKKSL